MTTPATSPLDEEAAPVVAVTRTIGGIVLVLVGAAAMVAGAFWYFIVPWFGWAMEGFWYTMADWADLGGVGVGILGILLLVVGGALIQRARKKRLQVFLDASQLAALSGHLEQAADDGRGETRTGTPPTPTIL
jgi:hypothetical protein